MKKAKIIQYFLVIALIISLPSCEDEINRESTHTQNVSGLVIGTYFGTIVLDTTASFNDVTLVLTKYANDSVDAVSINIKSSDFNFGNAPGLNLPVFYNSATKEFIVDSLYLNVAKANDHYLLASINSSAAKCNGRLKGTDLFMNIPILVVGGKTIFHANGAVWYFNGTKI